MKQFLYSNKQASRKLWINTSILANSKQNQKDNSFPFKRGIVLSLYKLEFPLPKDDLYLVWLKLNVWFWGRRFLNFVNVFLLFLYYLPLEMGMALRLNKLEFSSPKECFIPNLFEIDRVVLKTMKKWNYRQMDGQI